MKHIKQHEEYAYERNQKRKKEHFDKLGPIVKKRLYDANFIIKKLKKQFPTTNFSIVNYYDTKLKCVFVSDNENVLNKWQRDYNDGLKKEFANWLKENKLKWSWRHKNHGWDGITIMSEDYIGVNLYYSENPFRGKIKEKIDKTELYNIINIFKSKGYDVTEPEDLEENDTNSDRYIVEFYKYNMNFRFYIMRSSYGTPNNQIDNAIYRFEQIVSRHLLLIKKIYEYCETITEGPLWTMCSGGMQLQQFYGDDNGYLCILYLDMINDKPNDNTIYRLNLSINGKENTTKFKKLNFNKLLKDPKMIEYYNLRKNIDKYNL